MSSIFRSERLDFAAFLWFWKPLLRSIFPVPVTFIRLAVAWWVFILGTVVLAGVISEAQQPRPPSAWEPVSPGRETES